MSAFYDLNIHDLENYLHKIFDLEKQIIDKDSKIQALEFELYLRKQLFDSFKANAVRLLSDVN